LVTRLNATTSATNPAIGSSAHQHQQQHQSPSITSVSDAPESPRGLQRLDIASANEVIDGGPHSLFSPDTPTPTPTGGNGSGFKAPNARSARKRRTSDVVNAEHAQLIMGPDTPGKKRERKVSNKAAAMAFLDPVTSSLHHGGGSSNGTPGSPSHSGNHHNDVNSIERKRRADQRLKAQKKKAKLRAVAVAAGNGSGLTSPHSPMTPTSGWTDYGQNNTYAMSGAAPAPHYGGAHSAQVSSATSLTIEQLTQMGARATVYNGHVVYQSLDGSVLAVADSLGNLHSGDLLQQSIQTQRSLSTTSQQQPQIPPSTNTITSTSVLSPSSTVAPLAEPQHISDDTVLDPTMAQ
jgi:hypothetical protein